LVGGIVGNQSQVPDRIAEAHVQRRVCLGLRYLDQSLAQ